MDDFLENVSAIIRGGATRERGVAEAVAFTRAILASLEPERTKLIAKHRELEASMGLLYERAQTTQSEEDVIKMSEAQAHCDRLGTMLLEGIKMYSVAFEELTKLQRFEAMRRAPILFKVPNVETLRKNVAMLVVEMCQHWSTYDDSM